jgi:tRNA threonylcarbamoyladenosine biosynthesis protein TsaB
MINLIDMTGQAVDDATAFPPLLAIEMSQRGGSVAVGVSANGLAVERFDSGGERDCDPLLPAVDRAVRSAGLTPRDLRAIGVSVGPGGFTGLRISITASKCMSEALGIPVIGVPSALVAADASGRAGDWLVSLAAKRNTSWMTAVTGQRWALAIDGVPGLVDAESFAPAPRFRTLLGDEFTPAGIVERANALGLPIEAPRFEAASCWRVAAALHFLGGVADDPLRLAPLYPREPEAVTLWRQRHGDAGPTLA